MSSAEVAALVRQLYGIVGQLESLYPGRRFTPDGHLVGSIGEVLAAERYGLTLLPSSTEGHDATDQSGRLVQIKATQKKGVALRSEPEHLIMLWLEPSGIVTEVYNGPGDLPWKNAGKMQKNGQRQISVAKLEVLALEVHSVDKLRMVQ